MPHFDRASKTYRDNTPIQYLCSHHLARFIYDHHPTLNAFCDLGAGTGYLTEALMQLYPRAFYHLIDCSPHMIMECKKKWGNRCSYEIADIQQVAYKGFPASNFTFQWLNRRPSFNKIAFTTLLKGTWAPWIQQAEKFGIQTHLFYEEDYWFSWMKERCAHFSFFIQTHTIVFKNVFDFLYSIKKIGASGTKRAPQYLKPLLLSFKGEIVIPYKVLYVCSRHSS